MPAFTPFEGHYSNHVASCMHPVTGAMYILVTFHPNGSGPFNLQVWEHLPPYTVNVPKLIKEWMQGSDSVGPFAYGAIWCLPNGALHISVPVGADSASLIKPSVRIEQGVCPPYALGAGGVPGPQGPKGDTGPQGPAGAPGGGASLAPEDVEALRRLKVWLGLG